MYCTSCKTTDNLNNKPYSYYKGKGFYLCRPCSARNARTRRLKQKTKVFNHYGNKCNCCGEKEVYFLSIDHVNNDGNGHRHPSGGRVLGAALYTHIIHNDYPDSFQILCMNCNYGKHKNNGVCPHKEVGYNNE